VTAPDAPAAAPGEAARFELLAGEAPVGPRLGRIHTARGVVDTPAFMPVATRGMLRGPWPDRMRPMGVRMMLANAFHLWARPGPDVVRDLGGLHAFLGWDGPVLTDSGGFQAFSLREAARAAEEGFLLPHPVRGHRVTWTPELAFRAQAELGPEFAMVLDDCPPDPDDRDRVAAAVARTLRWARRQRDLHEARGGGASGQALCAIVQGGLHADLRAACAEALVEMEFDGYAVGGVSVGEDFAGRMAGVALSTRHLPTDRFRYLMGVGTPRDLVEAVARGVDLFDCVYPTRSGRFGTALTRGGTLHLLNARFTRDPRPIEPGCSCDACATGVPRGAIRAGLKAKELLPMGLLAHHNLHFLTDLMRRIREAVAADAFAALRAEVAAAWPAAGEGSPGEADAGDS